MSDANGEVQSGLEGVVAFATEIAEPGKERSALRYRGVDIEELVGTVPFEHVWGLLVHGTLLPGLPPAEPWPLLVRSGNPRVDVQSALARLAPEWGLRVLKMLDDVEREGDAERYVKTLLDRGERMMRFGPSVSRADDPRARVLPRTAHELGSRRAAVAGQFGQSAPAELAARKPDRVLA